MSLTERDLREVLAEHVHDAPGNAVRLEQVRGRVRRTRRHRQLAASGVLAVAAAAVAVGLTVPGHDTRAGVTPLSPAPAHPSYGTAALTDGGPVLLDVATGRTTTVPGGHGGAALGLSYDGRYLATSMGEDTAQVQVSDLAGHVLLSEPTGTQTAAWSPAADLLAVVGTASTSTLTLYDVSAGGAHVVARTVVGGADHVPGLAWSPDGRLLAVGAGHDLTIVTASGTVAATTSFGGSSPVPAAWSGDGSHVVVFLHSGSASIDADGVQVVDVDASGHQVGSLPESLAYPDWWHPLAGSAVLGTVGSTRSVDSGKTVVRCELAIARCTTLAGGARTSAFGAVPTATGIAYLSAANSGKVVGNGSAPSSLWLASADGSGTHPAPGAPATVSQVVASVDGRTLLLVGSASTACPSGLTSAVAGATCSGPSAVYRYDGRTATRLVPVPGDTALGSGYYGHVTEIVDWRQPGS